MLIFCYRCKKDKDISEFKKEGHTAAKCKSCREEITAIKELKSKGNKLFFKSVRQAVEENKGIVEIAENNRHKAPVVAVYKLKHSIYTELMEQQQNKCAICKIELPTLSKRGRKNHNIDHDHRNNQVRGLICTACNMGLGAFKDNIETIQNALLYLSYFRDTEDKRIEDSIFKHRRTWR